MKENLRTCFLRASVLAILLCLLHAVTFANGFLVKQGMRGLNVRRVQQMLIQRGYLGAKEADGIFGSRTRNAVLQFQKDKGLEADGVCDENTYRALNNGEEPPAEPNHAGQRSLHVSASAYSAQDPGLSAYTASGTLVRHGVIAVDPAVIPLGTKVYIPDYGEAVAEDVGWGIKGNTIDIAFDTHEEALLFGRQSIEIYIIE